MGSALTKFVKAECSNFNSPVCVDAHNTFVFHEGGCLVLDGKACRYFKDCVLGPEDYKYPPLCFVKDPAFEKRVREQYRKLDHTVVEADARRCECGAMLRPRQRYCDKCAQKRRWQAYRKARQKKTG